MKQEDFKIYISQNKVHSIEITDDEEMKVLFENGEWVNIGAGISGFYYDYSNDPPADLTQLRKDLTISFPDLVESMKLKYGEPYISLIETISQK